jgi:hypothetical protein
MRRFALLAALLLPFAVPAGVAAGGCPTDPGGLVDRETYRIGELIQFFDSYTDFGDPGTVTIHFERPADGATLDYTAFNVADGTWVLDLQLDSSSFVGLWNVTVTVDQTSGITTCTDVVTIRAVNAPNTDAIASTTPQREGADPLGLAALAGGAFTAALYLLRRRATPR